MVRRWCAIVTVCAVAGAVSAESRLASFEGRVRDADIARLRRRSVEAHAGFLRARATLAGLNAREAALATRVGANRTSLIRLLGALELWRRNPAPALVVEPRRAVDAARAAMLMRAATPELERRAAALGGEVRELARVRRAAAGADAALFAAESAAAETRTAADRLAVGDALDVRDGSPPEGLRPPLAGAPARRWGDSWVGHGRAEGWVWTPPPGASVVSPALARIEYAGPLKGFALVVILRLAGDWRLVLAGLQSVSAAPGATVGAGEALGRMATRAELRRGRPELYLELRRGVRPVDPAGRFLIGRR